MRWWKETHKGWRRLFSFSPSHPIWWCFPLFLCVQLFLPERRMLAPARWEKKGEEKHCLSSILPPSTLNHRRRKGFGEQDASIFFPFSPFTDMFAIEVLDVGEARETQWNSMSWLELSRRQTCQKQEKKRDGRSERPEARRESLLCVMNTNSHCCSFQYFVLRVCVCLSLLSPLSFYPLGLLFLIQAHLSLLSFFLRRIRERESQRTGSTQNSVSVSSRNERKCENAKMWNQTPFPLFSLN